MKKRSILTLSVMIIVALIIWFSCNPFNKDVNNESSLNVLDETNSTRLTIMCTIEVNGSTWDGGGMTVTCDASMGDSSQTEGQPPTFAITNGSVRNCTITNPIDGLHFYGGNSTISNVSIPDVGEDATTVKRAGTYLVENCTMYSAADKMNQINDLCTITYRNFKGSDMGKYVRQNGGTSWKCIIYIDGADLGIVRDKIAESDASVSIIYWRNITTSLETTDWWDGNNATVIAY